MKNRGAWAAVFFLAGSLLTLQLRLRFLRILPDPFFQPDSFSYLDPALTYISDGRWILSSARTPGYPIFLLTVLGLFKSFFSVLIVQHLLSICVALVSGLTYFWAIRRSYVQAGFISLWVSVLPRQLVYSHAIMTEIPYTFVFVLASGLFLSSLRFDRNGLWVTSILAACLATVVRPSGFSLVAAILLVNSIYALRGKRPWRFSIALVLVAGFFLGWSVFNLRSRGFLGITQFGGVSAFGSVAHLLDPHDLPDSDVKQTLMPIYATRREEMKDPNWVRYFPDGPCAKLKELPRFAADYDANLKKLALSAVRQKPGEFIMNQVTGAWIFLRHQSERPAHLIPKEEALRRGLTLFRESPERLAQAKAYFSKRLLSDPEYLNLIRSQAIYPFEYERVVDFILMPVEIAQSFLPLASVILGVVFLFDRESRAVTAFLLVTIFLHVMISNLGGDHDGRHAIPVEPLYIIVSVFCLSRFHRKKATQ